MSGIVYGFDAAPLFKHLGGLERLNQSHFVSVRREIGDYMVGNVQENLNAQRLFDGSAMPPSKAAQDRQPRWKRNNKKLGRVKGEARGDTEKTLLREGHLRNSYVSQLTASGVEIGAGGVAADYAAIHHFGGQAGRGHKTKIIARPILGVNAVQERAIGDFMIAEIGRLP